MPFTDIQGQESAVATLRNALARDRLGHAYLFLGPAGVGKKHTALTLAQAVLCSDTPREGCGTCPTCATVVAGTHPDVTVVAPVKTQKFARKGVQGAEHRLSHWVIGSLNH